MISPDFMISAAEEGAWGSCGSQ